MDAKPKEPADMTPAYLEMVYKLDITSSDTVFILPTDAPSIMSIILGRVDGMKNLYAIPRSSQAAAACRELLCKSGLSKADAACHVPDFGQIVVIPKNHVDYVLGAPSGTTNQMKTEISSAAKMLDSGGVLSLVFGPDLLRSEEYEDIRGLLADDRNISDISITDSGGTELVCITTGRGSTTSIRHPDGRRINVSKKWFTQESFPVLEDGSLYETLEVMCRSGRTLGSILQHGFINGVDLGGTEGPPGRGRQVFTPECVGDGRIRRGYSIDPSRLGQDVLETAVPKVIVSKQLADSGRVLAAYDGAGGIPAYDVVSFEVPEEAALACVALLRSSLASFWFNHGPPSGRITAKSLAKLPLPPDFPLDLARLDMVPPADVDAAVARSYGLQRPV